MISPRSHLLLRTLARHAKQNSAWSKRYSSSSAATIASADRRPIKTQREAAFATLGVQAYPRYTAVEAGISVISAQQVHERWDAALADGEKDESVQVCVQGRIRSKREAGRRLVFYDIEQEGGRHVVQAVVSEQRCKNKESSVSFSDSNRILLAGDIVRVSGFVGKTRLGETSVFATCNPELLAPCLHTIPTRSGLEDTQKRFRNRHLDLLVNPHARKALETRARILRFIRGFLDSRGFVEVETPVLSANVGGAAARPFVTRAVALGDSTPLFLRIAPELYLKQLVVGGFDRVYELGKQFRNEGIDADHNPEFTTCEFYQAYATVEDLMTMTEAVLREMSMEVTGSPKVNVGRDDGSSFELDFSQPFRRIHVTDTLYEIIPELPNDLDSPAALAKLVEIASKRGIAAPRPHTVPRLLDRFIGHLIEPQCEQPTFLTGHPGVMSPLAKSADAAGRTSARFELFANGRELVNAYEELNDPNEQRRKFAAQARERNDLGDEEVPAPDAAFCDALEFGLPPTGGWGMGVDRVVALLAGVRHLRETVSFALLKPGKQ